MDLGQIDLTIGLEGTILLANHIFFRHNSEIWSTLNMLSHFYVKRSLWLSWHIAPQLEFQNNFPFKWN